jgi:hypothetical protein
MSAADQVLPYVTVTGLPAGDAFAATGIEDVPVFMGPCSKGTLYAPRLISAQDTATLVSLFGCGPTVKRAARALKSVARPIVFVRIPAASVAGVAGSATVVKDSGSDFTSTLTGTPTDGGDILISFDNGGTTGIAGITYSIYLGGTLFSAANALGTATSITVKGVAVALGSSKTVTTGDTIAWFQTVASSTVLPVTTTRVGSSTSAITVTGTPEDQYDARLEVLAGGTIGVDDIKIRYCLDWNGTSGAFTPSQSLPLTGAPTSGSITATGYPLALVDGYTFLEQVDGSGGPTTKTIVAHQATLTLTGGSYAAGGSGNSITFKRSIGGVLITSTLDLSAVAGTQAAYVAAINTVTGLHAATSASDIVITIDQAGSGSYGEITAVGNVGTTTKTGAVPAVFTLTAGSNVADVDQVTAAELALVLAISGSTFTATATTLTWASDTTGTGSSVQFTSGTGVTAAGFDTSLHSGTAAGGASLLLLDGPLSEESTGLTTHYAAGTLETGDYVMFSTSSPAYDSAGVTAGINGVANVGGLVRYTGTWTWIRFCGPVAEALGATVSGLVAAFDAANLPAWGVVDMRDRMTFETLAAWSARVDAEWTPYTSIYLGVSKGMARLSEPINGRSNRHPAFDACVPRAMAMPIQVDWGEFDITALPADVIIDDANQQPVEYDGNSDATGVQMGAIALRHWPGETGVYPAGASLMGPTGDIKRIPLRRVKCVADRIVARSVKRDVLKPFRIIPKGTPNQTLKGYPSLVAGRDLESADILKINRLVTDDLLAAVGPKTGRTNGVAYQVDPTPIQLGGGAVKLTGKLKLNGLVYAVAVEVTSQFVK